MIFESIEPALARPKSDNIVEKILERWRRGSRGPLPQLGTVQLLNALLLIEREGPLGRRALSHALEIKDGVARGLLERLNETGVASVDETGVRLSKSGKESLHRFLRHLSIKKILPLDQSDLIPKGQAVSIHITGGYTTGMTGIAQRDEAIKAGAEGSITVASVGRKLVLPPDNKNLADLAPKENDRLRQEFNPASNDLIIIAFGANASRALAGALAAVFSLREK